MKKVDRKDHWESIYKNKDLTEVSWYQPSPETSLGYLNIFKMPKNAKIIDIGAGNSYLVDHLLDLGYQNITVLDISETALTKVKTRLGERASKVTWIVSDITDFEPTETYDFWHDRAAFHFLSDKKDIAAYVSVANRSIFNGGYMIIGGFSKNGPEKCSGIPVEQYSEQTLTETFAPYFSKVDCVITNHKTPSDKLQNFIFCSFKKEGN